MLLDTGDSVGRGSEVRRPPADVFVDAAARAAASRAFAARINAEIVEGETLGELRWYVLIVQPDCERLVAAHLAARRFGFYLPTIDEMVWESGRWRFRQTPILPGYVFVASLGLVERDVNKGRWQRARSVPGASEFLNRAGTDAPGAIPHRFIEELRAYEAAENSRFEVIHGRTPGGSYAIARKKSRKARRSHKLRRAARAAARGVATPRSP